jgi:replicative DNA helicase
MTTITQDPRDEVAALRVPPHSVEAEYSVLGGLLIDNGAWDRVADLLTEADFYRPEHKTIYSALGRLIGSMRPADVVTVFDALGDKAEECGGLSYLNQIAQSVPSAANCRRYAEIVRERSILRQLLAKADEAAEVVHGDGTAAEKVEKCQALFAGMESRSGARQPIAMDALMVKVMDRTNAAAEGQAEAWRTGIPGMDMRMNGGMRPGELHILAARPSVGKTSIALQIARRVATDGHAVLILSQEMADDQLGLRMLASAARVDLAHLQTGRGHRRAGKAPDPCRRRARADPTRHRLQGPPRARPKADRPRLPAAQRRRGRQPHGADRQHLARPEEARQATRMLRPGLVTAQPQGGGAARQAPAA